MVKSIERKFFAMQSLTATEESIMNCIWSLEQDASVADLLTCMKEKYNKEYARTTICVFMSYLREKGFVAYRKKSHAYVYHAVISREEYQKDRVNDLLQRCFDGSLTDLVRTALLVGCPDKAQQEEISSLLTI